MPGEISSLARLRALHVLRIIRVHRMTEQGNFSWSVHFVNSRLLYHRYPVILCYYPVCLFGIRRFGWKALKLGCPRWLTESAITPRILARTYLPGTQHRPTAPTLHARSRKPVASLLKVHVSHPHGNRDFRFGSRLNFIFHFFFFSSKFCSFIWVFYFTSITKLGISKKKKKVVLEKNDVLKQSLTVVWIWYSSFSLFLEKHESLLLSATGCIYTRLIRQECRFWEKRSICIYRIDWISQKTESAESSKSWILYFALRMKIWRMLHIFFFFLPFPLSSLLYLNFND